MVYGMPLDSDGARADPRQAARLFDASAGATGMRRLLVQPAGLVRRMAVARRARVGVRRSRAGGGGESIGLREPSGGDRQLVRRRQLRLAGGGRNGVLASRESRAFAIGPERATSRR